MICAFFQRFKGPPLTTLNRRKATRTHSWGKTLDHGISAQATSMVIIGNLVTYSWILGEHLQHLLVQTMDGQMVRWSWICSALWLPLGSPISSYQGTSKPNSWACWPRLFEKIADRHKSGMICLETLEPDRWRRHLLQQPWNAIGSLRIARSPGHKWCL